MQSGVRADNVLREQGMRRERLRVIATLACLCRILLLSFCLPSPATAQEQEELFTINLRNAEIAVLAEQVSQITRRTLVLDPALTQTVTVVSAEPLDSDGVWALFQSILSVRGYTAVRAGAIWEVIPEAEARSKGGDLDAPPPGTQDIVTRLLRLNRVPAPEAVRVLKPLVAESGYIEALNEPNAIVVTDTVANVDRIAAIAQSLDADADLKTEVIRFRYAQAANVAAAIERVMGNNSSGARVSVDAGTNILLVRGTARDIGQIRNLAASLDVAPLANPEVSLRTYVYELKFGDAEVIARIVSDTLRGAVELGGPDLVTIEGDRIPAGPQGRVQVSVQPSSETNSIIIRGTERQIGEVAQLIQALDVRRPQIRIEAAIVEVSGEAADRLGVQLGFDAAAPPGGMSATSFSQSGASLQNILVALGASGGAVLSTGMTLGLRSGDFGVLVQALAQSTNANLLSTPSVTTMDNEPATIVVGQNVPFRTGEFATDGNTVTPFTTIERRDVGIAMQVLPRVTSDGVVRLEISQEVSSLVTANVEGAVDIVTNRRVIETTVLANDGGTVVLGGLITDDSITSEGKVPVLGDVPVLGELFKSRNARETRRTLFVFMRPTILYNQGDTQTVAENDYRRVRDADREQGGGTPPVYLGQPVTKLPLEIDGLY